MIYLLTAKEEKELDRNAGKRIYSLRQDRGYSREYLAKRAHVSSKFIYEIENKGKGFSAKTLTKLAETLGVSTDYIMLGRVNVQYDQKLVSTISKFTPEKMEIVKKMLALAVKLTK